MQQAQASRNAGGKPSGRRAAGAGAASAGSATVSCVSCDTPKHSGEAPDCEPRPGRIAHRRRLPMLAHVTFVRGAPQVGRIADPSRARPARRLLRRVRRAGPARPLQPGAAGVRLQVDRARPRLLRAGRALRRRRPRRRGPAGRRPRRPFDDARRLDRWRAVLGAVDRPHRGDRLRAVLDPPRFPQPRALAVARRAPQRAGRELDHHVPHPPGELSGRQRRAGGAGAPGRRSRRARS